MHPRLRIVLAALLACALAATALGLSLRGGASGGGDGAVNARATAFAGSVRPAGIPPMDFTLADQHDRRVSLRDYRGRVVLLTFVYSTCTDACPLMAEQIRGALDDLRHPVPVLAVSVDPEADTPAHVRSFLRRHRLTHRMRYLHGTSRQLAPVWRAYGIAPQQGDEDHSDYTILIDRRGRQRVGFPLAQLTPESLTHDIRVLRAQPRRAAGAGPG